MSTSSKNRIADAHANKTTIAADALTIRPFRFQIADSERKDLHQRILATRCPASATVPDGSQGVRLATIRKLARYWATDYDWRECERRMNDLPQFITTIDGLDIHFVHVRSKHANALPIVVAHGWPGSIVEQLKLIGPLTVPTAHGGKADDAFDVVIPSMAGYGYSPEGGDDARRCPRQHHDHVAQQHGDLRRSPLLGEQPPLFAPLGVKIPVVVSAFPDELYQAPRSWVERVSESSLLPPAREGRPLRGLRAARAARLRAARGIQVAALTDRRQADAVRPDRPATRTP